MATPSEDTQHLCAALNRFALARAVAHRRQNRFVAWNASFRERTGLEDEAIASLEFSRCVRLGAVEAEAGASVQFIGCTLRWASDREPIPGLVASRADGYCYLMLDAVYPADSAFQHGRVQGLQEERSHLERVFLDEAGPKLLAAAWQVELAKRQLEAHRLDATPLAQASQALSEAIETLGAALDAKDPQGPTVPSKKNP
jgi:hypothetical protein